MIEIFVSVQLQFLIITRGRELHFKFQMCTYFRILLHNVIIFSLSPFRLNEFAILMIFFLLEMIFVYVKLKKHFRLSLNGAKSPDVHRANVNRI